MKFDVTKLPLGEALIVFVLGAVVVTFVLAFAFASNGGIEEEAVAELSPTPAPEGATPAPGGPSPELVQRGQEIAGSFGCTACHSTTGSEVIVGPSWLNLFGKTEPLEDGSEVLVDEAYIRESIKDPQAKLVQGFGPLMPTFPTLSDADIEALIAFIQSLSEAGAAAAGPTPGASPTPEVSPAATPTP